MKSKDVVTMLNAFLMLNEDIGSVNAWNFLTKKIYRDCMSRCDEGLNFKGDKPSCKESCAKYFAGAAKEAFSNQSRPMIGYPVI